MSYIFLFVGTMLMNAQAATPTEPSSGWDLTFGGEVERRAFTVSKLDIPVVVPLLAYVIVTTTASGRGFTDRVQSEFVPTSQTGILQFGERYSDPIFGEIAFNPRREWKLITDFTLAGVLVGTFLPSALDTAPGGTGRYLGRWIVTMESVGAAFVLTDGLKRIMRRPRPWTYYEPSDAWVGDELLYAPEDFSECTPELGCRYTSADAFWSFPSGHTSVVTSAAVAWVTTSLLSGRRRIGARALWLAAPLTLGAVTGYGRVRAGRHHPTDVAAGFLIGAASGILVPLAHSRLPDDVEVSIGLGSVSGRITW